MTCETITPLVSEYTDGTLTPERRRQVQAHLERCAACARAAREMRTMRELMQGLPRQQTSTQFEARLAQRLSRVRTPERRRNGRSRWAEALQSPRTAWRPAFAFGTLIVALAGAALSMQPSSRPTTPPPVIPGPSDPSLVSHCVEQHRSYMAAQPLSDWAAQALVVRFDEGRPGQPAASSTAPEEENF